MTAWRNFLEAEKKCSDREGLVYIQRLIDLVDPISEVLGSNDHKRVVPLFNKCITISNNLLPHITCEDMRQIHSSQIGTCQDVIIKIQTSNDPKSDGLDLFLRGTYMNLFSRSQSILSTPGVYRIGIHTFFFMPY